MASNYECSYLQNALMLSPSSEVRPCCRFDVSRYDIKEFTWDNQTPLGVFYQRQQFEKLREQSRSDQKVEGCHRCYREEELGIQSMRQKAFPAEVIRKGEDTFALAMIELGVGRTCNLKCRSCDPYFSTKWEADAKDVFKPIPDKSLDVNLDAIDVQCFQKTQVLKITGGEPFYHPAFERLVQRIVGAGESSHIDIEIFSNATRAPSLFFVEALHKFRSVTISLSVDGFDKQNTYIRHPSRWEDVDKTAKFWMEQSQVTRSLTVNFAVTVSILNILSLFDLFCWIYPLYQGGEPRILIQNVQDPKHLNVSHWPLEVRRKINRDFQNKKNKFLTTFSVSSTFSKRLSNLEKMLESPVEQKNIVNQFWLETLTLDNKRGESFKSIFPELAEILEPTKTEIATLG